MSVNTYLRGQSVRVSTSVRNDAGTLVDPDDLAVSIKVPAGTTTEYVYGTDVEVVRESTGLYHIDVATADAGRYFYRWESGTPDGADEGEFKVRAGEFA